METESKLKRIKMREKSGKVKMIGYVYEDTFYMFRNLEQHLYLDGVHSLAEAIKDGKTYWMIDTRIYDHLLEAEVKNCMIITKEWIYEAPLEYFTKHNQEHHPKRGEYHLRTSEFNRERRTSRGTRKLLNLGMIVSF